MATTRTAVYKWTATNSSAQTLKDGSAVNGYFTTTNAYNGTNQTAITGIEISLGQCSVLATGGIYLKFGDHLQTLDLSYSGYNSYTTHAIPKSGSIAGYITKEFPTWVAECASRGTLVRMAPFVVDSAQVQTDAIKISSKMTMTVTISYVVYSIDDLIRHPLSFPSSVRAGGSFSLNLFEGNFYTNNEYRELNYVFEVNVSVSGVVVESEATSYTGSSFGTNPQATFTVPVSWASVYPDRSYMEDVIGVRGYAYHPNCIFDHVTRADHGFGFGGIDPDPVRYVTYDGSVSHIDFDTSNTVLVPRVTFTMSHLIRYYESTQQKAIRQIGTSAPSSPANGDLWLDTARDLLREYNSSTGKWSWQPFLKDYTGFILNMSSEVFGGAQLDRYYIHIYQPAPNNSNGNKTDLVTKMREALSGGNPDMSAYQSVQIIQDLDGEYIMDYVQQTGYIYLLAYARDTRGMYSDPECIAIRAQSYTQPTINAAAQRENSNGNVDNSGTYLSGTMMGTWDSVPCPYTGNDESGVKFTAWNKWSASCVAGSSTIWTVATNQGNVYKSGSKSGFSTEATWAVKFTYTDRLVSVSRTRTIAPLSYTVYFKPGGRGVGIGKICENENSFEINPNWTIRLGTAPFVTYVSSPTGTRPTTGMVDGCICLQALS